MILANIINVRFLFNDKFTTQTAGGVTVYYISPGKGKVTAFKPVSPPLPMV